MKTSSIAVETSRSTTLSDSIVRQTNKGSSYLTWRCWLRRFRDCQSSSGDKVDLKKKTSKPYSTSGANWAGADFDEL